MYILWLSFYYHNSSACLIKDGKIIAAAQEERFSRKKNDANFPENAIDFCLEYAGILIDDIDYISFYEKPFLKLERVTLTQITAWPKGLLEFPNQINTSLIKNTKIPKIIRQKTGYTWEIIFTKHHESHMASSFFTSAFKETVLVAIDWVWEWDTTTIWVWIKNEIQIKETIHFPNSLGLFYSAFTYYLWFDVNDWEYKVMWLAPYWEAKYVDIIYKNIVNVYDDWSYCLNQDFFAYEYWKYMINHKKFEKLFGISKRKKWDKIHQIHYDIAASVQKVLEEILIKICRHAKEITWQKNLCLSWWVALNCVANSKILLEKIFDDVWIFPASWDDWWSIWSALFTWYHILWNKRDSLKEIDNVFWWPEFNNTTIKDYLDRTNIIYKEYSNEDLVKKISKYIQDQKVVGWFQWRMEFGPRSLWNRSILVDARNKENWQKVNLKIKFRESFRPFAPSVLEEYKDDYFVFPKKSPFMLFTAKTKNNSIPATTHIDWSSRIQTVSKDTNNIYYDLIKQFYEDTGVPVLINTSFNVSWKPIVCTPQNAYQCFLQTEMDVLVLWNFVIEKNNKNY